MTWFRLYRVSGYLGGVVLCGGCVARTCLAQNEKPDTITEAERDVLSDRGLTLRQVQVFFRHGARTPIHLIPNVEQGIYRSDFHNRIVPHTDINIQLKALDGQPLEDSPYESHYRKKVLRGGCILGSLTAYGQQQVYDLGRQLRQDYIHNHGLLDTVFMPDDIHVRSTNISRTINSARCVLAGLYGVEEINKNGDAAIHISKVNKEILLPNPHNCPLVRTLNHAAMIHFDNIPGIKEDRLHLETVLGISSDKLGNKLNFIDIRDDMVAREAHGIPVPNKLLPLYDMIDKNATKIMYHAFCGQHEAEKLLALRMTAGPAMNLAVGKMKSFVQGKSRHKMCLYSAHDSLLLPITVILDIYEGKWPPYAADIRLELYSDKQDDYWVRVLYCGKVQKIRGCADTVCKYSDFLSVIEPYCIQKEEYYRMCTSNILEKIAKDLVIHEKGEEAEERSDIPAGL